MHIPERGTLYFTRGVTDPNYMERLEVYVSTTTRRPEDFHLVKSISIADHFNEQYVEEVDLSDFANKDVYVALAIKSEKLQGMLDLAGDAYEPTGNAFNYAIPGYGRRTLQ